MESFLKSPKQGCIQASMQKTHLVLLSTKRTEPSCATSAWVLTLTLNGLHYPKTFVVLSFAASLASQAR